MDLYLSNCYKIVQAAAAKAAASGLTADREQCDSSLQKNPIPEVRAAHLLDLPLGVKLPVIPGSNNVFYTTNLSEKLYQPSYDFNLTDPYCRLLETGYKSLHDPHLKTYYRRKDILRRLKKGGYVTSSNKVICTLKELNKYRQYLTTLKLDFERNYIREQKLIEKQVNKLHETKRGCDNYDNTQFQDWLLQESTQTTPDQELLIKQSYLDMVCGELNKLENMAEKQSILQIKEEERRHRDHIRRKLSLRRQIEEEWKTKEMLILTKIGEEVKREARVEEQRRKVKEAAHWKKQVLLEKKITYHLQKMQKNDLQREGSEESIYENKSQDETEGKERVGGERRMRRGGPSRAQRERGRGGGRGGGHLGLGAQPRLGASLCHAPLPEPDPGRRALRRILEIMNPVYSPGSSRVPCANTKGIGYPGGKEGLRSPNRQQDYHENCCQERVTSEELNSIIQNIMTWVVAAVTSVLYPAITKYEERSQNITYPMPDDSTLSSDSESCCSTCCETFLYETSNMVQAEPCTEASDRSIGQPMAPSKSSSAHKERRDVERTYHREEHLEKKPKTLEPKYNETSEPRKLKTCKSDSHLVALIETGTRKCKDAATETDGLECPLSSDEKAKAINEMQESNDVFVNFKYHLKEETDLILGNVFHEIVSDLTQTIPTLSSVTANTLVDPTDTDKGDLLSNVDISSAADEIMENVLEKLQSEVEKKRFEESSQENVSVHFKPNLVSGEYFISPKEKTSKASLPYALENMNDTAEDMVHMILEKLTALASSKQSELAHLEITTEQAYQQHREDPTYMFLQRASKRKSSAKPESANLIGKEEIQNVVSNIFSQSSLVGYIEEAISTILGYIQIGLNNERLIATEETVIILQVLDDILAQLHQKPVKTNDQKSRHSRMNSPCGTEEENRLISTGVANAPRCGCLFPPINVPGMVLYSEDENEEIDKIVENVLISSIKDEKAKLQEQFPDHWLTRGNTGFKYKRNMNLPTKPAYQDEVALHDCRFNTDLSIFNNKDLFKDKPGLNKDISLFSQDETYQIQKASENIVRNILAQTLKDISSGLSDHLDYKNNRETSFLISGKPKDLSHQEWMDQMFSVSEIHTVAQEIVDAILKILHISSSHIIGHSSSVHQTSLDNADVSNKEPLEIWFDSKRKMKFLPALGVDSTKHPWLEPEASGSTSEPVDYINDKVINTVFKKLNSFICPKLQNCFKPESHAAHSKPEPDKKSSSPSHLSAYTVKVVKIILDAIQKELQYNKKNLNLRKSSPPRNFRDRGFFADTENELDSVVTKLNNDIMTSSLATCICEVLSGNTDKSNILFPSDKLRSKISHGTPSTDQQKLLPSHCPCMQEEVHQCTGPQVLDRIGDTLYDMLCKLVGDHPHSPLSDEQNTENLRTTSTLQSNIKLVSRTILEGIVSKLCGVEIDCIFKNSELKAISEYIDTDSLSFALLLEEMSRCSDIISSMLSNVTWPGSQKVTNNKGKTTAPKTGTTKEKHLNKLKTMASDILEMVSAKLEDFVNRTLETLDAIISGNKKNSKTYWENENANICANIHEKLLRSTLYMNAKKVSTTILKAIQTELNVSLPDLETRISKPLQEKQMLKNLVNFILDAISPDMFNETEIEERGIENYRYRPVYGNFLPGGADPESYLEDPADTEKESAGEERPTEKETKSHSLKQQELERTLKKFEVELKEPQKSPVVPIIRTILNEIFQNDLIDQLNVLPLPQSHLCDIPHAGDEPLAQTSVQSLDTTMGPLVSEADVTIVADNVVRTIFQKLYSAAMTGRNENENRYNTITFPANISFPEHTSGGKSPVYSTILDRNPCTLQSTFDIGKLTKINVVEDIIQSVVTNLETFASSKVKALFCPQINFTVPMVLPLQQDETALSQPWLSTKDLYSDDQFSCCPVDHNKSGKTTSICQLSVSKLNIYATEVARQILQGIKHKLEKEIKSPFLIQNVVASEGIPSRVVNTMLDIVSTKGKYEKNIFDRETDPSQPEDIVEKLFNKSDYRKKLQFQILDTIEGILIDICEETIDENNLPLAVSTLKCNVSGRHLETNSERDPEYANKAILRLLVPKECVAMISNDMVDIVLQNLTSAIMLGVNAKDSISLRPALIFSDAFPKAERQQSPVIDSVNERKRERLPFAIKERDIQLKSAYSDDNQTTVLKKQDAKKSAPEPCEENTHFMTKTILNRLKSFATERIDLLLILDTETREKPYVGPEFTNYKQDDSKFLESNQAPLDVNILKIPRAKTILSQEVRNYTFANYRENHGPAIHISQVSLKEYADIIASTILTLIKNDIDVEIQKMYTYQNNTSFQENIIASETVNNILKSLHDKISLKSSGFYSKQDPGLFTQLAVQNEILPGQRKMEDNTELPLFSKYSDQNQIISEAKSQRRTLEEIFRNGESGQEKTTSLLSVVKEILKKVYQRVMEDTDHWPPFNEFPHFMSDSKIKTSAQKKAFQSRISSVANDIVESVFRKVFSIIMTSLYENSETRGELEASGSDELLMSPSRFRELKQAEKRSVPPEPVILQVYPYTGIGSVTSLENTSLQFSPLRLGKQLVQKVLKKITDFALLNLEETSPKGSPKASFKTNFRTKSKVTSSAKFGTKPQLGPSGAKAKSKTKLGPGEKTLRGNQSKTSIGLPHMLSIRDAKNPSMRVKLPTTELKIYARDIVSNILETIVSEFQEVRQNRAMVNVNAVPSDQIEIASKIVNAVLQGLYATKNNLAHPIKGPYSDDLKLSQEYFSTISFANPEAHFSLESASSQLEKIYPKEDIFKQMFDKWRTESSDMDKEKYKLLMIAEPVLNEISMKTKELEQSVSLLNLSFLEPCESRHHNFKRAASRVEDSQAQINIFGQEIVGKLFEKLELCSLTQMFTMDSKETLESKKETAATSKCGSLRTNNLDVPTYNTKLKDKKLGSSGHQIAQEILEGVLNILESFVDLQFKHVSMYAFSEIVRTPIENFFAVQQKPLMKTILPKLQTLNKFPDESKSSSMISQENIQNTLQQLYSFHSELLTYTVNTVSDMLSIIKNKLDKEKCQEEPSSISTFEENIVASQIISTLMDQCTDFYELMSKSHPKENLLQGATDVCTVNWSRFATGMGMSTSKLNRISSRDDLLQIPGSLSYSEEDIKIKDKTSSNIPSYVRYSAGNSAKTTEPMEGLKSELKPSSSRSEAQVFSHFDQAVKGNCSLPEGTVLQKSSQKSSDSAEAALEHPVSFREMEEGENQRVLHYEPPKPVVEPIQIQTTISPLKICLAAENIVNTLLLSYGLTSQTPHTKERMETMKPFFISKERLFSVMPEQQKDEKSLLKIWGKRNSYETEEENKSFVASGEDSTLLEKWKNKYPRLEKIATLEKAEVIAFADEELGPHEIHLVARYVTTSVVTHFKNFETRGPLDEKVSIISTLLSKKYESKQPLRSTNSDSSLNQFCEHLTELVISYIISSISDCTEDGGTINKKSLENQDATFNKVILVHSQVFESRSISIRGLALSISEIIIQILLNSDILKADVTQVVSVKAKYIYCPKAAVADSSDLFQDLLIGVIHVLSKEIGINHHLDSKRRNKSPSTPKSHSLPICNKTKTMKKQIGARSWKSAPYHQINQLVQKNKLNSLACKLDTLVGSLKTHESKEVVNKIFSIVFNLFLPDECPNGDTDSGKIAREMSLSSNYQQSHRLPRNNLGLSPKSAFLLNVVCEKLIRILLEECATNNFLTNVPLSDEISTEHQLFSILQNVEDYCQGIMDRGLPFEGYDTSDLLENLAEIDQESMLSIISHSLVKSLMEKLSCSIQQPPRSPPLTNKHLTYRTRERPPSFRKAKRPELKESRQGKDTVRFMSYDSKPLTGSLNNLRVIHSKMQTPFGKQFSGKFPSLPPLQRPGKKEVNATAFLNMQYPGGMNTGVYPATFLEEIIADIFLNLTTSVQGKNVNITEAQLNEMNILYVNSVVNEFNNAQVTVLRDVEEKTCFPPIYKETVSKIVDSVYNDVLWDYALQVTCGNHLARAATSIAEQITNGILKESVDYQLPPCFVGKLMPNSYYPLKAENILHKLQNNLSELNYQDQHSTGYTTILSHSFLEDVIRRLLSQLIPPPSEDSCLGRKYLMTSDFNEISNCIINKVLLAISKHKIWLTKYNCQYPYAEKNLQNMVESVYNNILQMCGSLVSIQKSIESQSPIMVDRMASLIIQEIIENHLQPFLCEEGLPHSTTPLDEISNMVKEVLSEVTGSHRPQKSSSLGLDFYPKAFVEEIVARLLSKVFNPKHNTKCDLDKITPKIINSINNHFNNAKICILRDDQEQPFPTVDIDTVDELVNSVYENVLKQHGLAPEADSKEFKDSDIFAENITNLIVAAISDYLFHPLFSGDLLASSNATLTAENIIQNIFSGITEPTQPSQHLSPYNTLLPYTFLEDIIRVLLSRIFPSSSNMVPCSETPKDRSGINHSEISSKLISDIRTKISQHEIRFSKDEDETESVYSEDDAQRLVDSTFRNILQNSGSQEAVGHNITSSDNVLIDRIAGFIIKNICQQHLHPLVYRKLSFPSSYSHFDTMRRRQCFFASVYSSAFLEDVISGVLSKIFHRVLGIVQTKSLRDSEKELLETAEKLIYFITEEFSKVQVSILENAKEQLCLPPVDRDIVIKIIDMAYSKVLQEYELEPNKDFLSDTKTLAERVTKIILAEVFDFQIPPYFIAKLPFKSYSKLNADVLIKRVHCAISKSRLQRQTCTTYTTILSHTHLEKIVTQVLSQLSPLNCSAEDPYFLQSDFSHTVVRLINEIMSIISKHAICIIKYGSEKQNVISEQDIQAMVDAIYNDISYSNLYQSPSKDKKGISNIPVTKIASYIIREVFNHHLESFLSGDKTLPSGTVDQTYQQRAIDPKQRELSFIVNSAIFLEEVISELLCKILYVFSHNVSAAKNPCKAKANITHIVTRLVKSIVLEFTTSQILVADHLDENLYFSEGYKEMVKKTVNIIYEKILDDYQSLVHIYRALQNDAVSLGKKIYYLLLGEIYDYQVESLVSGELAASSYSSLQEKNIIRNVLNTINDDSHDLPSCIAVLPHSLLEDMICKLLAHMFPSSETETEPNKEEAPPDYEFVNAASKLTDDIIREISEHEIRLAEAEEHVESLQLGAIDNFVDSICNNVIKKIKFEDEAQKNTCKRGGSFLGRIAGFIMKEIVDHHLQPFLCNEESFPSDLPQNDHVIELLNPIKEKIQPFSQASIYSAAFLEDVVIDLVRKFYTLPSIAENPKDKEISERNVMGLAIKFANALIGEFRKSEIKVLANAKKMFSFPPIDKETVDKVSDSVYDEVIEIYGSKNVQKHNRRNTVIEKIAALAKKAISAFKIQPLFWGGWSSTFFSFLDVDSIIQRVQYLPYKTFTKINRSLKENAVSSLEQLFTLIPITSGPKDKMDTLEIDGRTLNGKENFKKEKTSMKTGSTQEPICTNISSIMKSKVTTLASGSVGGMSKKKKGDEKKKESSIGNNNEKILKFTSPTTSVKSKDTQGSNLGTVLTENEIKKKDHLTRKDEKGRGDEVYQHLSPATDDTKTKVVLQPNFKINDKKKSDKKKVDRPFELPSLKFKVRNREIQEKRRDSPAYTVTDDKHVLHSKYAPNVPGSIYRNVLEISSFRGPVDDSKSPNPPGDKAVHVTQVDGKDFARPASMNSTKQNAPTKGEENEKSKDKEIKSRFIKWDNPQNPPKNKSGIFPANFLEDVISEIVNKLIFSSSPDTDDARQNVTNDVNQTKTYDMAMKLIDSLLREFSDAQIKVLNPDQGSKFLPSEDNISSVHKVSLRQKEQSVDRRPPKKKIIMDNIPPMHNMAPATKIPSSDQAPFMAKIPSIDKMLVNKIVHSSICNILQEYRSQDSICEDINSNVEKLARRLANAVIEEIFQHRLNLLLYDEVPDSVCLPLESKEVMKKVHKVAQTACKECQTSSPYTIMLPHEFLERIISSLLSKIFSVVASAKTEISDDNLYTELDFLQMKLASTVITKISKDEDMNIQCVESLHPKHDEIIQLVVQTIYNNLLPQFGSQERIQKCISCGCKILSEAIVNLVVQEVTGNQLQNYFLGELTPFQCTEVDSVVENILKDVIQTTEVPQPQPSQAYKLPFNIIEEIAVSFLSKLLSMFPKADKEQNSSLNAEMQKISTKILTSFQEYISKSQIIVVRQVKESSSVSLADSATIEKVVTSVYNTVLKHSGSHISVYKDLMGKSNVLSDIIGFLMVKEISNSEFHPQVEEETSSSELVLEAVKIMDKVVKITDDLKSKKKPSSKKKAVLDARVLEEILALFLIKLVKLPSASSKDAKNLSKSELNKIASQLTKSVTAEISRKNISIVAANPEENFLNPESTEIISQMVDSVYNHVLQQSGTHEELYHDMKSTNHIFPKEVASLIIRKVSNCPLETISPEDSCANLFGDLDVGRIVEKAQEHAVKMEPELEQTELDQGLRQQELSVRIIPHRGKQPINIDPDIVAEHLGVISIKTQSLEKLQMECLARTGHSIESLRRGSISGKSYSTDTADARERKKEKRISLDQMGRLNVKPLETASRNSFQSLIKPDITKVELLKDVQSKKDLIIRLITHDISQEVLEKKAEESFTSDEDEVVLQEVVKEFPEGPLEDQVKKDVTPTASTGAFSKPLMSKSNLKKFFSLGKCCQPKSSVTTIAEASPAKETESEQTQIRTVSKVDVTTSKSSTDRNASWEKKTQLSGIEMKSSTEPTHYFIHRIMSSSSYDEEDLPSFSSGDDERPSDPSAKITEEWRQPSELHCAAHKLMKAASGCLEGDLPQLEKRDNLPHFSFGLFTDSDKPSTSKQGSEIMKKVSSALSEVFSRSNANVPKSSSPSPPQQDRS
ncbi:fibrous sheath-interacting protein 2-like [Hippopotamus amphibius kiboko]|uniref:fibrous sheath-interacting protein 2-like n=1 Tax=Hippopotamus amphibius kiboko TaxID=575201 RepID=UPI002598E88E|nr:fibrous sheath-interacting protein 2-like [Hippopotamus amphibius kiboko]